MNLESIRDVNKVYVFKDEECVGDLERTDAGVIFSYESEYLKANIDDPCAAVAFRMPLTKSNYRLEGDNLHPFFAGLLPEGVRLTALVSALKTSADDMFSLLAASGTDCVGDVFVYFERSRPSYESLETAEDFPKVSFTELFESSITSNKYAWRVKDSSIPGVQPKISAELASFPISIKKRNKRYILKLSHEKFPQIVENEHFFMNMAKGCGLDVASTTIVKDVEGKSALLVERFDRIFDKEVSKFRMIHQEDACQFLDLYPQDKYRVSMRKIADGVVQFSSSPIVEAASLLKLKIFSYLIANGDLHAKNISLQREYKSSRVKLSPAYDLLTTFPYKDHTMALELEGKKDKIRVKDVIRFADRLNIREDAMRSLISEITQKVSPYLERLEEIGFKQRKTDNLRRKMRERLSFLDL